MKLLLDTHVLLWSAELSPRLSGTAAALIKDPANELFFSPASIWETVIKSALNRPDFSVNPFVLRTHLLENGYNELSISSEHTLFTGTLPWIHRDPFDRILIAQAAVEGLTLLTSDPRVASYPGPIQRV